MRKTCLFFLLGLVSCSQKPLSFTDLKGWNEDSLLSAVQAVRYSCEKPTTLYRSFCRDFLKFTEKERTSLELRSYLENHLEPHYVGAPNETGRFTGYYEPVFAGSFEKTDKYNIPLRAIPKDMVRVNPRQFGNDGKEIIGRVENGRLVPYYERREIEEQNKGPVLLYLKDMTEKFLLQVQGSGKILTENGMVHVGYAGSNGLKFKGIGTIMAEAGVLEKGKSSMPDIKKWLQSHPTEGRELMMKNPRYIFFEFKEETIGTEGVPLTPARSLAVDTRYVPLGSLLWLETTDGYAEPFRQLMVAQDTGSAIKGKIRGDVFWGSQHFDNAGRMNQKGRYFILLPKEERNGTFLSDSGEMK